MRKTNHSVTITIPIDSELAKNLVNYLNTQIEPETTSLKRMLQNGLKIETGDYHDEQLVANQQQLEALNRNAEITNKRLEAIENGIGDIDDHILENQSDFEPLIDKTKLKPKGD